MTDFAVARSCFVLRLASARSRVGQRQAGQTERPDAEEVAAGGAVTGASAAAGEHDVEHRVRLRSGQASRLREDGWAADTTYLRRGG